MPTEVDSSSVFDTVLPNVYIKKVTLVPSTPPGARSGVEYDMSAEDSLQKNQFGKKQVRNNQLNLDDAPLESRGLRVDVEVVLKDRYSQTGKTLWFERKDSLRYMGLRVVLSRDSELTKDMLNRNFTPAYLKKARKQRKFLESVVDLQKFVDSTLNKQEEVTTDGQTTYDVSYTVSFFIEQMNPKHLSVFANTYTDINRYLNDNNSPNKGQQVLQGTTSAQSLINNGRVVNNGYVYVLPNGKIWAGPVHYQQNGDVMAGAFHTRNTHPTLTKKIVSNYIVEDYRVLEEMSKVDFLLQPQKPKNPKREKTRTSEELKIIKEDDYFSEPHFSSDQNNRLKFLFHINYEKIIMEKTQYGAIFETADLRAKKEILQRSRIKNLSIFRNRVERGLTRGSVREVELEDRTEMVANSSETIAGNFKRTTVSRKLLTYDQKSREVPVGAIKEINLSTIAGTGVRSFGVTDYDMEDKTDGFYRYTLEMEIEDGTIFFVKKLINTLATAKKSLQEYYIEAKRQGHYIPSSGKFSKRFIDLKTAQYNLPTEQEVNDNLFIRNTATRQSIVYSPWLNAVSAYLDTLYNVTSLNLEQANRFSSFLLRMCQPSTGTVQGLELIIQKIEELESRLKKNASVFDRSVEEVDYSSRTTTFKGKSISNSFSLSKKFNTIHDSNIQKKVGYDFLSGDRKKSIGPRLLTTEQFRKRMDAENDKYFSIPYEQGFAGQPDTSDEASQDYSRDLDLQEQFFSFLTPAVISLGDKNDLRTLNRGSGLWSEVQYDGMASSILAISQITNVPAKEAKTKTDPLEPSYRIMPPLKLAPMTRSASPKIAQSVASANLSNNLVLGSLNISLSTPAQYDRKIFIKDLEDGIDKNLSSLVDPREVLGENTKFATDRLPTEDQAISEDLKSDSIEEKKDLTKVSNTFISPLLRSTDGLYVREGYPKSLDDFSSSNKLNIIDAMYENIENGIQKKKKFIADLPNQIKSLILAGSPLVRKNWSATKDLTGLDIIKSTELYPTFYFLYNHINKVEVFMGFQRDDQGLPIIKRPIFRKMTKEMFEEMEKSGLTSICRLVPYSNSGLSINKSPKMNLPEFDTVFLIGPRQTAPEGREQTTVLAQPATDFSVSETRQDTYESRITQNIALNSTGLEIMKEAITMTRNQDDIPPEFSSTATVLQPRGVVRAGTTFSSRTPTPPVPVSGISSEQNRIVQKNASASLASPYDSQRAVRRVPTGTTRGGGY